MLSFFRSPDNNPTWPEFSDIYHAAFGQGGTLRGLARLSP